MNLTENIEEGYGNGLLKTALEFENCKQQLFTPTIYLPACLRDPIARTPFNYTITARTLLAKCDDYQFQRLNLQFPALVRAEVLSEEKVPTCFVRQTIS